MKSKLALTVGVAVLLAAVLLVRLKEDLVVDSFTPASEPTKEVTAQQGLPPANTDQRPPVTPTTVTVELCGYGQITVDPQGDPYPAAVRTAARDTLTRAAREAAASSDPDTRAAGVYVAAVTKGVAASDAVRAQQPDCEEPSCFARQYAAAGLAMQEDAERLAASVSTSRSGRAYATALSLCDRAYAIRNGAGPCARLSHHYGP